MAELLTEEDIVIGNMYEMELKRQLAPVVEKFLIEVSAILRKGRAYPNSPDEVAQTILKHHIQFKTVEHFVVNLIGQVIGRSFTLPMLKLNITDLIQSLSQGIIDASANERSGCIRIQLEGQVVFGEGTPKITHIANEAYMRTSLQVLQDFVRISDRMKDDDHTNRPKPTNKII